MIQFRAGGVLKGISSARKLYFFSVSPNEKLSVFLIETQDEKKETGDWRTAILIPLSNLEKCLLLGCGPKALPVIVNPTLI